jgi:tetratricopeptide (TPR) repeat protein
MSSPAPHPASADANLLFGILALQMDFITRDQLVAAMHAWVLQKSRPLGQLLREQQALGDDELALLEALVAKHLEKHGGDAQQSLQALGSVRPVRDELQQLADADVQASLAAVSSAGPPDAVGAAVSVGDLLLCWQERREQGEPVSAEALCTAHPELLAELRRQIEALASVQGLLGTPPPASKESTTETPAPRMPQAEAGSNASTVAAAARGGDGPSTAGPRFRKVRTHAEGGLGKVYLAHDEELGREVALKEIKERYADDSGSRSRFVLEAAVTGGLEHPGIVPVYSLGCYADGRPYYAMRFIKGESLKDAIEQYHGAAGAAPDPAVRDAALRQLLRRFYDVCNAMAYAHHRGVLHRDLKPGNIMLGKYGETLVVDWGLAKAQGRADATATTSIHASEAPLRPDKASGSASTQAGAVLGTPAFMSPEQAGGQLDRLGPASDVYSLGATLYYLLTGQAPVSGKDPREVLDHVRRGMFLRPRQVKPAVAPALEAICLKAMALRPEERYATAAELGQDIERWLDDQPVRAWPEPWTVRTRRWARRHRTLVTSLAVALVSLSVLAALLLSAAQQRALRREYLNKEVGLALADALAKRQELQGKLHKPERAHELLSDIDQWQTHLQATRAAFERARALAHGEPELLEEKLAGQLAGLEQDVAADERDGELARELDTIRLEASATVDVKAAYQRAASKYPDVFARAGLAVADSDPAALAQRLARVPVRYAVVAALDHWAEVSDDPPLRSRLLEVARRADPDPWRDRFRQVEAWNDRATLEKLAQQIQPAQQSPQVITALAGLLITERGEARNVLRRALLHHPRDFWLNFVLGEVTKDPVEREARYQAALALRPRSATAHTRLGKALWDQRDSEGAIAHFEKAFDLDPNNAAAHTHLGVALMAKQDVDGAIAHLQKALAIDPTLAEAHNNLGFVLWQKQELTGAIAHFQKALAIDSKNAMIHNNLGQVLREKQDVAGAVAHFQQAIAIDPTYALAHHHLGLALYDAKDLAGARAHFDKAVALDRKPAQAHYNLGNILRAKHDLAAAIDHYQKAIALDPAYARAHHNLGGALLEKHETPAAIVHFKRAIELDPKIAEAHSNLGVISYLAQDLAGARAHLEKALALDPKLAQAHCTLGHVLWAKHDLAAIDHYRQAVALDPKLAQAHYSLGNILRQKHDLAAAIDHYRKAVALDPAYVQAHNDLGNALLETNDAPAAMVHLKKALDLDPKLAHAHGALGIALLEQGQIAEAHAASRQCLALLPVKHPMRPQIQKQLQLCEQLLALDRQLAAFLAGGAAPEGSAEKLALAELCLDYKRYYATAVRLYGAVFTAQPALADDWHKEHRYRAACAALLAAAGKGQDPQLPVDALPTKLRAQALAWLRADVDGWRQHGQTGQVLALLGAMDRLPRWQQDARLESVREAPALAALGAEEQAGWRQFWADVALLLKEVRSRVTETPLTGTLSEQQRTQTHLLTMQAATTYVLDMHSRQLDSYLRLHDGSGKLLAENDDIAVDNPDARLIFTPPADGTYRLVATSFEQRGRGAYTLTIRAISGAAK